MKIIDEKGKIFGKLNIIDLLVVLVVIAAAVLLAVRHFSGGTEIVEPAKEVGITYQVQVVNVDPRYYETVRKYVDPEAGKSDQMFSSDNKTFLDCYVVDCVATPHVEYVTTSDGQMKRAESSGDDDRLDMLLTLEGKVTNLETNAVGTQQVRVGIYHYVKTTHFEFYGAIMDVEREDG